MLPNDNLKAVCTVTEMTKKLGLSRARFYQLQKMGIFPKPLYLDNLKRPFYPLDLQQQCLKIRKTGIDSNGKPIIFYAPREKKRRCPTVQAEPQYQELTESLRQIGLNVTGDKVKAAVKALYPDGLTEPLDGEVIGKVHRYLNGGV